MLGVSGAAPWNHIVSKDLIHWSKLPRAIEAGNPGDPDENSCGSGSVMERNGTFYIFYTGFNACLIVFSKQFVIYDIIVPLLY